MEMQAETERKNRAHILVSEGNYQLVFKTVALIIKELFLKLCQVSHWIESCCLMLTCVLFCQSIHSARCLYRHLTHKNNFQEINFVPKHLDSQRWALVPCLMLAIKLAKKRDSARRNLFLFSCGCSQVLCISGATEAILARADATARGIKMVSESFKTEGAVEVWPSVFCGQTVNPIPPNILTIDVI